MEGLSSTQENLEMKPQMAQMTQIKQDGPLAVFHLRNLRHLW